MSVPVFRWKIAVAIARYWAKMYPYLGDDFFSMAFYCLARLKDREVNNTYLRKYIFGRLKHFLTKELKQNKDRLPDDVTEATKSNRISEILDGIYRDSLDKEVIRLLVEGYKEFEIQEILGINYRTIRRIKAYIRERLTNELSKD